MRRLIPFALCAILAAPLLAAYGRPRAGQDAGTAPTLEQRVQELEATVAAQKKELVRITRIADALVAGTARLAAATEESRVQGFESAGPNPDSRIRLLDGLKGFTDQVKKAVEPPPAAPAPKH